jgi:hypothetical protein
MAAGEMALSTAQTDLAAAKARLEQEQAARRELDRCGPTPR